MFITFKNYWQNNRNQNFKLKKGSFDSNRKIVNIILEHKKEQIGNGKWDMFVVQLVL